MPNLITHIWFGKEVANSLPEEIRAAALKHEDAFTIGSIGPDYLFALREIGASTKRYPNNMQYRNQLEVFTSIARYLAAKPDEVMVSYALGLMCHYAADLNVHPFVNFFCEEGHGKDLPTMAVPSTHGLIESGIDQYVVTEIMDYENSNDYHPDRDLRSKRSHRLKIGRLYMDAIDDIMGIKMTEAKASLSIELTRIFLAVANDKSGRRKKLFRKLEAKYFDGKLKVTGLMRPPLCYGEVDYLNFKHREFRTIRNREGTSTMDAMELLELARKQAQEYYVPAMYNAIFKGGEFLPEKFVVNYEGVDIRW